MLDQMAEVGRGKVTTVMLGESPEGKVDAFYEDIARPVLTEIEVDFGEGAEVWGMSPLRLPDLFVGEPLKVVGRFEGELGPVTVRGRAGSRRYEEVVDITVVDEGDAIGSVWARQQVKSLEREQLHGEIPEVVEEITDLALEYRLLTRYTSFVAVEYRVRNTGGLETLVQPNQVPVGVDGEAAVGGDLSRLYMPPGDPLLTIEAPVDAREVIALFPWGPVVEMDWDEERQRWFHRFLVPRDVDDGEYVIRVFITLEDGSTVIWRETLVIDSLAPELDVVAMLEGENTVLSFLPEEPLRGFWVEPVGRPDLRERVDLRGAEGPVELVLPGQWEELRVVAKDRAMNRIELVVEVTP